MAFEPTAVRARSAESVLATNKVLRNTYTLLAMTLLFSGVTAVASMFIAPPPMTYLICVIGAMVIGMFVLPKFANSAAGLGIVFLMTGMLGFGIGPLLNMYLQLPNGPQIIGTALGGTGIIFLGLSGYALMSKKDFSFMGGFLMVGFFVVLLAAIAGVAQIIGSSLARRRLADQAQLHIDASITHHDRND